MSCSDSLLSVSVGISAASVASVESAGTSSTSSTAAGASGSGFSKDLSIAFSITFTGE